MKRELKRQIEDILKTMLEIHGHVAALLKNKKVAEVREFLAQCQNGALLIGEIIEKSEGMGTRSVAFLEEYCEQLYIMSETVNEREIIGIRNQLDTLVYRVKDEMKQEVSCDKVKIVFMPYKVSMWDCMESIWEAANADKMCEVFVVPVPYYERNQQGELRNMYYEGDSFPDYVPITHYKKFLLEEEHPDIVYIHNPYDGANYVTCVHPDFHSSNIKKYVKKLVYIPYYICGNGPLPEMHRSLVAYHYVDKIIVQDKEKKESLLEYVPEEKIVVVGSPKVDYLLKINRQKKEILEYTIPRDWRQKIKGKKVILFNISITGILQNSKYAMKKVRYILSKFEEYENIVVLWRPHPLIESTLKSMRPEMYREYISIKKQFIQKKRGILDETGDAGIATVVADAYLGENTSSLVHYFGVLGKPVLYIDWTRSKDERDTKRDYLYINSFFKEKDNIYFPAFNKGMAYNIYQLNLQTGNLKKTMSLPGVPENIDMCYSGIKKIENKIILIPYNTADLYVYDMNSKQAIRIVLPNIDCGKVLFGGAVEYKNKLFLIPTRHHAIICVDIMKNEVVCEYRECIKPFLLEDEDAWLFTTAYLVREQYLYLATCNDSRILILNMDDGSYEIKRIGEYTYGYVHMIYDGKIFWLAAGRANHIVRWDEESGDTREYTYPIAQNCLMGNVWSLLLDKGDYIIVCYGFTEDMVIIDKETGDCQRYRVLDHLIKGKCNEPDGNLCGFVFANYLDKETIVVINQKDCSINIWNVHTEQGKKFLCRFSTEEKLRLEKEQIERWCISKAVPYSLSEKDISIGQFIDYIAEGSFAVFNHTYDAYLGERAEGSIGMRVHEYMKGELM